MTLQIGPIQLDVPVGVLAPMAGVTNVPFRRLRRAQGAGLYVSEMITACAYVEGNANTQRLASFDDDEPLRSIELYGIDAHNVARLCAAWSSRTTSITSTSIFRSAVPKTDEERRRRGASGSPAGRCATSSLQRSATPGRPR